MQNDEEIRKILQEYGERITVLEKRVMSSIDSPLANQKELSVKEFLLETNPSKDAEKVTAIGLFLEKYKKYPSFTSKDLEWGFREAKEKPPANINARINDAIAQGFIMSHNGKKDKIKAFVVTRSGEEAVENKFRDDKK